MAAPARTVFLNCEKNIFAMQTAAPLGVAASGQNKN
jgi:hypothetical protein